MTKMLEFLLYTIVDDKKLWLITNKTKDKY